MGWGLADGVTFVNWFKFEVKVKVKVKSYYIEVFSTLILALAFAVKWAYLLTDITTEGSFWNKFKHVGWNFLLRHRRVK